MNTLEIEDRVRAATRAAAETVAPDSVPPLRLPADRAFRSSFASSFRSRLRSRPSSGFRSGFRARSGSFASGWGRWLAPMAAAAAVVAVAVAMVTVGRTLDHSSGSPGTSASSPPGPVQTGPPVSSYVASGSVPQYYVSIESRGNPNFNPSYAVVRATATGAALGTYTPAAGQTVMAVTGAADDRTFMVDVQPFVSANSNANQSFEPRAFYELRLSPGGGVQSVNRLPFSVPGGELMTGFALSPDGSKLAVAVQPDNNQREPDLTEVKVITLATGAVRTWTANGTIGIGPDDARSLSWTADEGTLAFTWAASGPGIHTGVWLLDLATSGDSLMTDSREAVSLINQASIGLPALSSAWPSVSGSPSPSISGTPSVSPPLAGSASPTAATISATPIPAPVSSAPACQLDSVITPDGSAIVCGAIAATNERVSLNGIGPASSPSSGPFSSPSSSPSGSAAGSRGTSPSSGPLSSPSSGPSSSPSSGPSSSLSSSLLTSPASGPSSGPLSSPDSGSAVPAVVGLQRGAETEFIEYSTVTGKVTRILGHWTFGSVGALSVDVLWSNASGSVLIGVIPDSGGGRVGVISGNEFTPLPATASTGTW